MPMADGLQSWPAVLHHSLALAVVADRGAGTCHKLKAHAVLDGMVSPVALRRTNKPSSRLWEIRAQTSTAMPMMQSLSVLLCTNRRLCKKICKALPWKLKLWSHAHQTASSSCCDVRGHLSLMHLVSWRPPITPTASSPHLGLRNRSCHHHHRRLRFLCPIDYLPCPKLPKLDL